MYLELNLDSRKALYTDLGIHIKEIKEKLRSLKPVVKDNQEKCDLYKEVLNTLQGVQHSVKEKTIKRREVLLLLKEASSKLGQADSMPTLKKAKIDYSEAAAMAEKDSDSDYSARPNGQQSISESNDQETLTELRSSIRNLPSKIKGTYSVATVPLIPIFSNYRYSDPKVLGNAGFKVFHLGEAFEGYAILAEERVLIVDYNKYSKEFRERAQQEKEEALEAYKEEVKSWEARALRHEKKVEAWEEHMEDWTKRRKVYENEKELWDNRKLVAKRIEEIQEKYEQDLADFNAKKLKKRPIKPKFPTIPKSEPEELFRPEHPGEFNEEKPVRPRIGLVADKDSVTDLVYEILEAIKTNLKLDYTLMAEFHKANPKNTSLMCFWIVEKWKLKGLNSSGRVAIEDWDFAFNQHE